MFVSRGIPVIADSWSRYRHFCSFTSPVIRIDSDTETGQWYHGDPMRNIQWSMVI